MDSLGCSGLYFRKFGMRSGRKAEYCAVCIFCVVQVLILVQLWALEKKSQWFSLMAEKPVNGGFAALQSAFVGVSKCNQNNTTEIEELKRELKNAGDHLRDSVRFLPLKDTGVAQNTDPDRTPFMSTLRGKGENGNPEHFYFPSEASKGRILCVQGRHSNGTLNSYGFAWQNYLPSNSTLLPGLTFISESEWHYSNPWHAMTALVFFALWRKENECASPERIVLYTKGGLQKGMGSWISDVMRISLGRPVEADPLESYGDGPVCFEKAMVCRRGTSRMTLNKTIAMFDMIRCKARNFCNVSKGQRYVNGIPVVNVTLLARTGARSFTNESAVASIINTECLKVAGCNFRLFHAANLSFCEQVSVMSTTDIVATVHGAQLTNMIFMSKNSSVMEMFPKGWLEGAGPGQYTFHWLANWAGIGHEGTWRDSEGPDCPNPEDGRLPCFSFHKNRQVGHNPTYLAAWTADVLLRFQNRTVRGLLDHSELVTCPCHDVITTA